MAIFKIPLFTLGSVSAFGVGNATAIKTQSSSFFDLETSLDVLERQREASFELMNYDGPLSAFSEESEENIRSAFRKYGCIKSLFGDLDNAKLTNSPVEKMPANANSRIGCALAQADYEWGGDHPNEPKIDLMIEFAVKKEKMGWILGIKGSTGGDFKEKTDASKKLNVTLATLEKKNGKWEVQGDYERVFSKEKWNSNFDLFGKDMEKFYGKEEVAKEFEFWTVSKHIKVMMDKGKAKKAISTNKISGIYTEYDENKRVSRNIKAVLIEETSKDVSMNINNKRE